MGLMLVIGDDRLSASTIHAKACLVIPLYSLRIRRSDPEELAEWYTSLIHPTCG